MSFFARRLVAVLVTLATVIGALAVFAMHNSQSRDEARSAAVRRAGAEAVALQRQLDRTLNAPVALAAFIQLNEGRVDGFEEFTDRMRQLVPSITNLQLAPDGVVTHIHPLEGHEAAIGHELLSDPDRTTEAFVAVESRRLTVAGPFELLQGGDAMVGRQPIYLPGAGNVPGLDPDFWGFATVLIFLDDFFAAGRIDELGNEGYGYEIAKFDRDESRFVPFWSSGTTADGVSVEVPVENGTWLLTLGRAGGWGQSGWSPIQLGVAAALALLAGVIVLDFQRRRARLEAVVDQRTSDLRIANVELMQARDDAERSNQAKTTFLSNVSHELRTPMNAILGFAELIDPEDLTEVDAESMTQIRQAGRHLLGLINEVLDVTAIESGDLELELEPVDVDDLVQEVHTLLGPLADAEGIELTSTATSGEALAHRRRLFQVVSNLVANAVKFTPPGGQVHISTTMQDGRCLISVADDGVGIADEHLEGIFRPFERGGAPDAVAGAGLGLAIVAKLVEAMGGDVSIQTRVGVGSTFWVCLPTPPSSKPVFGSSGSDTALVMER